MKTVCSAGEGLLQHIAVVSERGQAGCLQDKHLDGDGKSLPGEGM